MASLDWRTRAVTVSCVCTFLAITRAAFEDPWVRAERQYLFVITLGYGHLIGAAVFARQRLAELIPAHVPPRLAAAAAALGVLDLFAVYVWATHVSGIVFLPMLVVSIWHVVENDRFLARASDGSSGMGPMPRSRDHHVAVLAATALFAATGQQLLSPEMGESIVGGVGRAALVQMLLRILAFGGGVWLGLCSSGAGRAFGIAIAATTAALALAPELLSSVGFGDFFSAVTLYHLVQFLLLYGGRIRRMSDGTARRARVRLLAWVHVPALALCASLLLLPGDGLATFRYAVFSPAIYLFWSVLHVAQTLMVRGVERRRPVAASSASAC